MSEEKKDGEGQETPQGADEYQDYSQQEGAEAPGDPQAIPEGAEGVEGAEGYPEGYPEGTSEEYPDGYPEGYEAYRGRTGVPDYVPEDLSPPDPSLKESNKSGAIKLIVGIVIVLVIAGIGVYLLMGSQKEIKEHETARDAYKAANLKGQVAFWKKAGIAVSAAKDVTDFNRTVMDFMKEKTRVPFAKMLKAEAVPILDAALPDYEAVKAPPAYADKYKAVLDAYKAIKDASLDLSGQLLMIDAALDAQTKLTRRSDAWFNAQTWDDPQYLAEAFAYYKMLGCLIDRPIAELKAPELSTKVDESCAADKIAWYKRVAVDCFPLLLDEKATPDEAFKATVAAYRKTGIEAAKATPKPEGPVIDELSIESVRACSEAARMELEGSLATKLKATFLAYEKASKDFLAANNDALAGK